MTEGEESPGPGDEFTNTANSYAGPTHTGSGNQVNYAFVHPSQLPGRARRARAWLVLGASSVVVVAATVVAVLLTQAGAAPAGRASGAASSVKGPAAAENLDAQATWCCKLIMAETSTGFYWPGSVDTLSAEFGPQRSGFDPTALTPAGLGLIEIPVQTSGTEPILVAPPKAIVRSRSQNLTRGVIAILPRGGQGGGVPGQFEADVDNPTPVTTPLGATGGQSAAYQYVSGNTPEILTLFVADKNYDCVFDVQLTWREQGRTHTTLLTNDGKHFRILGSTGLPWYAGDPRLGVKLKRVSGRPFSHYAPGAG